MQLEQQLLADSFNNDYHPCIHVAAALGREKLLKYFSKADQTGIYIIAMRMYALILFHLMSTQQFSSSSSELEVGIL